MTDFEQKKLTRQERNALRAQKKEQDRLAKIKAIPESIHGIPVIETEYTSVPNKRVKALRREFSQVRKEFLKMLAETQVPALKQMGLSDKAIEGMAHGKSPNGFNTHHKIPLAGGGTNVFDNFILIKNEPYHEDIHKIMDPQICVLKDGQKAVVKLPLPKGNVFIPPAQAEKEQTASKTLPSAVIFQKIQKTR